MKIAIEQAKKAKELKEIPVGAVMVSAKSKQVLSTGHNTVYKDRDPTAHAEINIIRKTSKTLGTTKLDMCDMYVTLEPCAMCAAAISLARIKRVFFGAYDVKGGGVEHGVRFFSAEMCLYAPEVFGGLMEIECRSMLEAFFSELRKPFGYSDRP
ncbi:MAG: nucleoside deaminase [Holosporales bacterium]|jgi:tRNA(Arg) A34 adenosine deaminase TadA|nr:nucleoside deaminase [Holosporales bacterium]